MLVVNLYGAPGSGKSTGAAYIFSRLKMAGVNAELVTEFAKDKVWEESKAVFQNQQYIFGKQYFRLTRLEGKVDVVVTDSPILLSAYYGGNESRIAREFQRFVEVVANEAFSHYDVFIRRVKPYNPAGRFQNEEESDSIARELVTFLADKDVSLRHYDGDIAGYDQIVSDILRFVGVDTVYQSEEA